MKRNDKDRFKVAEELSHQLIESRQAEYALIRAGLKPIWGADGGNPSHPLGPPTVSGNLITVDTMLNQPTRITRMIMDLTLQRFIADRVFASAGGVTGGAVIYEQALLNELYTDRDVERISPGGEFPTITAPRHAPKVAEVEKWGGKVFITDEAKDRNNSAQFTNKLRQVANTIVRKINQIAVATLEEAISGGSRTFEANDWTSIVTGGASQSNASLWPAADFAHAQMLADEDELGVVYNLWLMNPQEYAQLVTIYGAQGLQQLLSVMGIQLFASNRVPKGKSFVVAEGQPGEMRIEKPLSSATWREEETERTWVQSGVRPVMYVTDPFSVLEATGLAG